MQIGTGTSIELQHEARTRRSRRTTGHRRRRRAAISLLGVALLASCAGAGTTPSDRVPATAAPTAGDTASDPGGTPPSPTGRTSPDGADGDPAAGDEMLDDGGPTGPAIDEQPAVDPSMLEPAALRDFVEEVRRVELVDREGQVLVVDDETFFADLPDVIAFIDPLAWRSLRVLGLTDDDATFRRDMQARRDRIRGICCPSMLRQGIDELEAAFVSVHELAHQADDRAVPSNAIRDVGEVAPVVAGIVEGNAQRVAFAWFETLPAATRADLLPTLPIFPPNARDGISEAVARLLSFGYAEGRLFADVLADVGGEDAIDAALADPPTTSEQVLFPQRYLDREGAAPVPAPTAPTGAERVETHALGAFGVLLVAEPTLGAREARELAGAWAGDAMTGWSADGEDCVALELFMDDTASATAVARALGEDAVADELRVTSQRCVDGG